MEDWAFREVVTSNHHLQVTPSDLGRKELGRWQGFQLIQVGRFLVDLFILGSSINGGTPNKGWLIMVYRIQWFISKKRNDMTDSPDPVGPLQDRAVVMQLIKEVPPSGNQGWLRHFCAAEAARWHLILLLVAILSRLETSSPR